MELPSTVNKVAIVGTGIIGSGWAALFCAKGYTVVAFVRSPASKTKFLKALESAWHKLVQRGVVADPEGYKMVTCVFNLAECVADADYVQESVVENLTLKQCVLQEIDQFAPPHVIVGSATSFIPLSLLRARAKKHPERIATFHPTQVQYDPFCEVLGSSEAITHWLAMLFGKSNNVSGTGITGLGMDVVPMKRENHGHVFNCLLQGIAMISKFLVKGGVCNAPELDCALVHLGHFVVASGGMSGAIGLVGGGSTEQYAELMTDIVSGGPMAYGAIFIDRIFPSFLAKPALWILQIVLWPMKFLRTLIRHFTFWLCAPFFRQVDESPTGVATFEAAALNRFCILQKHVACEERQDLSKVVPIVESVN